MLLLFFAVFIINFVSKDPGVSAGMCETLVDATPNSSCYDKDLRPNFGGQTDDVYFGVHVYEIGPLSESTMSLSSDLYVRMYWVDRRLTAMAERLSKNTSDDDTIMVKGQYADAIWRPNIFFVDSMEEHTPAELSKSKITLLKTDGRVLSSTRVVLKTRCPLDLSMFPVDSQNCPICFSSYMYNDKEQLIQWLPDNVEMSDTLQHTATFDIDPELQHSTMVKEWGEGDKKVTYTSLCITVSFNRKFYIYIVTMFLPSISLVVLSWVSFLIDKNAVPARAGITITTILAQITLITGTANKFPGVADLKVGDVYMIGNFFFVFGSLIEFALVNSLQRRKRKKKARKRKNSEIGDNRRTKPQKLEKIETVENGDFGQSDDELKAPDKLTFTQTSKKSRRSCVSCLRSVFKDVDRSALILFPICFVIWHICFLSFCVLNSTHQKFI